MNPSSSSERHVIASYCATFLKPEMLHIYRQITGLNRVRPIVITQKQENASRFPFESVYKVGKPATHLLRRFWFRQLLQQPWQISRLELDSIRGILDKSAARLLHIYFGHIAVHLVPLIKAWPRPTVVSFHGADVLVELDKPAYRRATQEMLAAVRGVFVRSESLKQALLGLTNDQAKIEIVRTGIPLHEFPFRPRPIPTDGRWQVIQAGRLIEKKGMATSLRAFAEFAKAFPNSRLTLAGDGPLLFELEDLAGQLNIADKVVFAGFLPQNQLRDLYYRAHIFVHPSQLGSDGNQEGVPNSMLEAMASGLPVFATNHGGIPEAIEHGRTGILVHERDHGALGRELIQAAQNPDRLMQLARAGSDSVAQNFEQQAQINKLEDLYLKLIRDAQ
ncbi:MAG TPA: glycosyltransferase [Chthoniobacterales bacterium]|nr:glycosyltransferase [Chthoniobacterales bacterium]